MQCRTVGGRVILNEAMGRNAPSSPAAESLIRPRLLRRLSNLVPGRLTIVHGHPGSGKTTALQHWADATSEHVAWHSWLPRASHADLASTIERDLQAGQRAIVIDNFEDASDPEVEAALERLVILQHWDWRILLSTSRMPPLNMAKAELGCVTIVSTDELNFRSYEVDHLFVAAGISLNPDELRCLTASTGGWAAALTLFRNGIRGRPYAERRAAFDALAEGATYCEDYVERFVLSSLRPDARNFLDACCLLDELDAQTCDVMLGRQDSAGVLRDLVRDSLLMPVGLSGRFRIPPLIRRVLVSRLNRKRRVLICGSTIAVFQRQGAVREWSSLLADEKDWDGLLHLLHADGPRVVTSGSCGWAEALSSFAPADTWCELALARQRLDAGHVDEAAGLARDAMNASPRGEHVGTALRILQSSGFWADSGEGSFGTVIGATRRDPLSVAGRGVGPFPVHRDLVKGCALLLAGDLSRGIRALRRSVESTSGPCITLTAQLILSVVEAAPGPRNSDDMLERLEQVRIEADHAGLVWLSRLALGISSAVSWPALSPARIGRLADTFSENGDGWGGALVAAGAALVRMRSGVATAEEAESVAERFAALGAETCMAWARAGASLLGAWHGRLDAEGSARQAAATAHDLVVPGAEAMALAALAVSQRAAGAESQHRAVRIARNTGMLRRPWDWPHHGPGSLVDRRVRRTEAAESSVALSPARVTCFGGFTMTIGGTLLDFGSVRPRALTVLHLLALHAGHAVHRDLLAAALWAEMNTASALHNLHVSISSLRHAISASVFVPGDRIIVRHGETYALAAGSGFTADLASFDDALRDGATARTSGDVLGAASCLRTAVDLYAGDVLPEDGSAEWVVGARERYRLRAAEAATSLAQLELKLGNGDASIAAAARAVEFDPWRDSSWKTLIVVSRHAGDIAAAERASRAYSRMLSSLGVPD